MITSPISRKCIGCGIEIKDENDAFYLCKSKVSRDFRIRCERNKITGNYERKNPDGSTVRVRMHGGAKNKHLLCLTCFNRIMWW
jgi:hypothetical protein